MHPISFFLWDGPLIVALFSYRNTRQILHDYWLNWQIRRSIENPNFSRENGARQQP